MGRTFPSNSPSSNVETKLLKFLSESIRSNPWKYSGLYNHGQKIITAYRCVAAADARQMEQWPRTEAFVASILCDCEGQGGDVKHPLTAVQEMSGLLRRLVGALAVLSRMPCGCIRAEGVRKEYNTTNQSSDSIAGSLARDIEAAGCCSLSSASHCTCPPRSAVRGLPAPRTAEELFDQYLSQTEAVFEGNGLCESSSASSSSLGSGSLFSGLTTSSIGADPQGNHGSKMCPTVKGIANCSVVITSDRFERLGIVRCCCLSSHCRSAAAISLLCRVLDILSIHQHTIQQHRSYDGPLQSERLRWSLRDG